MGLETFTVLVCLCKGEVRVFVVSFSLVVFAIPVRVLVHVVVSRLGVTNEQKMVC